MKTDKEIEKDVVEELQWEPSLNFSELRVLVHNGVVTLSGSVTSYSKKDLAEFVALRVKGVIAVAEDIEVRVDGNHDIPSWKIAEDVVRALEWNTTIPDERLKVRVNNGWVYLEGEVDWPYQKEAANNAVKCRNGVKGLSNMIRIKDKKQQTARILLM